MISMRLSGALAFLLSTTTLTPSEAAPWLQQEGESQLITTTNYYSNNTFYNNAGSKQPQPKFTKYEINPYYEYGLTNAWTMGISTFLSYVSTNSPSLGARSNNIGLTDTEIFARTALYEGGGFIASVQPLIKLPSVYTYDSLPRSGTEDVDAELRLLGGYSFKAFGENHFASVETAYRSRFGNPNDQIRADATLGIRPMEQFLVLPQIFTTWRVDSATSPTFTQSSADDFNLVKLQLSGVYDYNEDLAFQLGGFWHTDAKNTGGGGGVLFSVWTDF